MPLRAMSRFMRRHEAGVPMMPPVSPRAPRRFSLHASTAFLMLRRRHGAFR